MKHFLTFLLCLVASLTVGAVPTTPTFSTEDGEATWYYIRFKSNYNCYLTDCGVGNNVQVMGFDLARADDQQWKVVGESTTSFTLVNKAGHKLYYNSSTLRYVTSDTEAITYAMDQYTNYWELYRTEVGSDGKRFGISGNNCFHGAVLTEKNKNNDLNKFIFVPVANALADYTTFQSKLPLLSDVEEPVWYYLSLTNSATHYLVDAGESTKVALNSTVTYNDKARQWQLVPVDNEGGFALRSRLGHYITSFSNSNDGGTSGSQANGRYYTGAASATINDAIVFCLGSGNTVNDFEIYRKGDSNKWGFNKRDETEVGVWNEFNGGNKMACADAESVDGAYNAYLAKLPKFSDESNEYWYILKMTGRNTYMKAASTDTKLELASSVANSNEYKWKFIGTKDNFVMVSKAGMYVYDLDADNTDNGRFQVGTESASAKAFYFDPCGDYVEIVRVGDSNKRGMNDRSINTPSGLGIWTNDDSGNRIQFFESENMFAENPTLYADASSLTNESTYYYIQFKTGGAVVEDKGADTNAQTAAMAHNKNGQLWAFIGTELTSLKAINKAGRYLSYSGSNYQTATSADDAVTFELRQSTAHPGYFELINSGATQAMNQVGGTGAGKNLGVWTIGDANNPLKVILPPAPEEPIFYANATPTESDEWYYMQFCNGSFNWIAPSTVGGQVTVTKSQLYKEEMMWRFIGNKNSFKLMNKKGEFAYFDGTNESGFLKTSASDGDTDAYKFSLVVSKGSYAQAWEIKPAGVTSTTYPHLNMYQGAKEGTSISVWSAADGGNPMKFIPVSAIEYADYTVSGSTSYSPTQKFTLWYTEPATTARLYSGGQGYSNWMEWSLPIGNGQLGASLFGGVMRDEIQINEKTLWSGRSTDQTANYGQFENFGSVFVENIGSDLSLRPEEGATDYYRSLDLADALGKVYFKSAKSQTEYTREYFASNPDKAVVAHYVSNGTAKLNLRITMKSGNILGRTTSYAEGSGFFSGNTFSGSTQTIKYALRFKVVNLGADGTVTTDEDGITVADASDIMVVISGATDFDPASPTYVSGTTQLTSNLRTTVNAAAAKDYTTLKNAHLEDHHALWNRMSLELDGISNTVTTNALIDSYNSGAGTNALMLENLYFAYGRYLEIASSRGVALPSNLQGIWSNMDNPAWNADIHSNINVQMNYWPAEQTNLSEMHEPFLNYIINMANSPQWKGYATAAGQSRGWTCYTENNIFGGVGSFMHNYVIANAWYCTHLWQHYRYTLDKAYLQRAFPAMLSAAQFWMDRLVLDTDGTYVCPNEYSPEHGPGRENGVAHAQQLVYDLFDNTLAAIRILGQQAAGISDEDLATLKNRFDNLDPGLATEIYDGTWGTTAIAANTPILREWKTSAFTAGQNGHRHMSHLMCLYPFSQVTPGTALYDAAVNSLRLRGDGATGWSMGWKINLWARAKDGDHSRTILNNALRHANGGAGVFYNLYDSHAPFQIDGNFGACAGMAEMIMQSQSDTIEVLPALPSAWTAGTMTGMKAVGNFTVDITWSAGKATLVRVVSHKGQPLMIKAADIASARITKNSTDVGTAIVATDVVRIPTEEGDEIIIDFTQGTVTPDKGAMEILTAEGYGTFFSDRAIEMPAGVTGAVISTVQSDGSDVGKLQTSWDYAAGSTVPANTALLIKGEPGTYEFNYSDATDVFNGTNLLHGQMTDALIESEANTKYYKLTYSKVSDVKTLGFFYGAADGAAFVSKAGKAWLAVPTSGALRGYSFDFGTQTGITGMETEDNGARIHSLDGRRVNRPADRLERGVYVIDGRKIIVK
ncbi:glycosyl hydrolase family 95 catalytic domain-containing protein [Prevotellamassilia timonensis]|uniref:glycosyl hydrolase family 95 catalytic domain-containing protein n=1 Tax=Prevotellamassilia timonensis TaxID=1852370 RepID=UPI001F1EEB52|nr:glycoside hydrolase N-terminal domain-containing protein [Prevotellamassilia timonensis]